MKKYLKIGITLFVVVILAISVKSFADVQLDTIHVNVDKTIVRPGEQVTVTVDFGQELGSYTIDIAYDDAIFEYVSAEGGTPNNTSDKVRVVFYDAITPRTTMQVTFKAKDNITTSNPTEFTLTAEGMASKDAQITYENITIPIIKNITVEPEYVPYTIALHYTGDIVKNEQKEMVLSYGSTMGRYYDHARLIAETTTPLGATVQLIGQDQEQLKHDIIQSGWGDAQGFAIGGKDALQSLNINAIFSDAGEYTVTLKLIDRDNADATIAENSFHFTISETQTIIPTIPEDQTRPNNSENSDSQMPIEPNVNNVALEDYVPDSDNNIVTNETEHAKQKLLYTGNEIYMPVVIIILATISVYAYYKKER